MYWQQVTILDLSMWSACLDQDKHLQILPSNVKMRVSEGGKNSHF